MYKRNEKPNNVNPDTRQAANRGGRPVKEIDVELIEKLAGYQLTLDEIAAACKVSPATLDNRIASNPEVQEAINRGRATGRASLRRAQMATANAGNPTMLIWLGKQYLAQQDRVSGDLNLKGTVSIDLLREIRREAEKDDSSRG
jgi:AcrR family transcriptional regulator